MMDERARVIELTKKGIIVTPEMLSGSPRPPTGVGGPGRPQKEPGPRLSVNITKTEYLPKMSVDDVTARNNNRHAVLGRMLSRKMSAVSINKAKESFSGVSVIGTVRERVSGGFVLEDTTGDVVVSGGGAEEGDVIGVRGTMREGRLVQNEMVWPDVPLTNGPAAMAGIRLLLSASVANGPPSAGGGFDLAFVPDGPDTDDVAASKIVSGLQNPCHATIRRGDSSFGVLIYKSGRPVSSEQAISFLRKRYIKPPGEVAARADPHIIEPLPNLFWIISDTGNSPGVVERYRGVTIIISGSGEAAIYDTGSGEAAFL